MQLIDGKATAAAIKKEIAEEVARRVEMGLKRPHLAAVLVGHDGGSETYVRNKVLACEACGFTSSLIRFEDDVTEEELLDCVARLNRDQDVDGFIVQLPLPPHISEQRIIEAIDYRKDVDGFHPINVGRMAIGLPCFISAIGQPGFVTADMVKPGAVIIDVGTTRVPDASRPKGFRLAGDVDFDNVAPLCSYITPVPGGVGPMTITMLMLNTLEASRRELYITYHD